ncbi:uricase [Pisolithus thermaeus]|nr:uricase [Pisolithus croceorrhizus]KAI6160208.1 uricase [Pisolithus thermaeus]
MSASTTQPGILTSARYGKDKIRVFRIVRNGPLHDVVEYNVQVLLEGDIAASYTKGDNSVVVATDSMKNITYYLAKTSPHILTPEHFALHLGTHILVTYAHIQKAHVSIEKLRWSRISVGTEGQETLHPHSFTRDGEEKRFVNAEVDKKSDGSLEGKVTAGLTDLLVLKTTGSGFTGFIQDAYTTLTEVSDRILSTSVDLSYTYKHSISIAFPTDERRLKFDVPGEVRYADEVARRVRKSTLDVFAVDESESVQATLFKMAQQVVAENDDVETVTYTLPNKHYIPVDMRYIGVDNLTPSKVEVFMPVSAPSGLISATISRK